MSAREADLRSSANTGCRAEKKYYLANLPAQTDSRTLAATIKARWICEQVHHGLDHFEGRSWQELMITYAFLQYRRLPPRRRHQSNRSMQFAMLRDNTTVLPN
jgi:hypothetical protein